MQTQSVQLADVIYNAANQTFEALATVHSEGRTRKYACEINAPITMTFKEAAAGLTKQALRRESHRGGLYSEASVHVAHQRAGRPRFDPRRWLEELIAMPGNRAA